MNYPDQCASMEKAGWISHAIACCNIDFSANKRCTMALLRSLRTYRSFDAGEPPPVLNVSQAVTATLHFTDGKKQFRNEFLVEAAANLVSTTGLVLGRRLVGYLSDIPPTHLRYDRRNPKLLSAAIEQLARNDLVASDLDDPPSRIKVTVDRIVRDTVRSNRVKTLHDYRCQICGQTLLLADGSKYAEAHHIKPLGGSHKGPDKMDNIICVCPNHHAELDFQARPLSLSKLRAARGHRISPKYVSYHNFCHQSRLK